MGYGGGMIESLLDLNKLDRTFQFLNILAIEMKVESAHLTKLHNIDNLANEVEITIKDARFQILSLTQNLNSLDVEGRNETLKNAEKCFYSLDRIALNMEIISSKINEKNAIGILAEQLRITAINMRDTLEQTLKMESNE